MALKILAKGKNVMNGQTMPLVEDKSRYVAGEEKYWLAFSRVGQLGIVKMLRLFDYFGSMQIAWEARVADLRDAGLEARIIERLVTFKTTFRLDDELNRIAKLDMTIASLDGPNYPERLAQIERPPPLLYLKGNLEESDRLALAVVGTRQATNYGKQATNDICKELAEQGVTIVSGLAKGIDTVAHQAALAVGGRTIAVLGCGVDVAYPVENKKLAAQIVEQGMLISEYAPGTQPDAVNFPPRNRIVSGISLGVFLVESGLKGGAMITAGFANEQGRDVYALPGSITNPLSVGPNSLIRTGARLVTSAADILEELQPGSSIAMPDRETRSELANTGDSDVERAVIAVLRQAGGSVHIDEVCRGCALPMSELSSLLMIMELKGMVRDMGNKCYGLTRLLV